MILRLPAQQFQTTKTVVKDVKTQVPQLGGYTPTPAAPSLYSSAYGAVDEDLDPIFNGGAQYSMTGGLLSLLEESEAAAAAPAPMMDARKLQQSPAKPQMIQTQTQAQTQSASQQGESILLLIFGVFIGYALSKLL